MPKKILQNKEVEASKVDELLILLEGTESQRKKIQAKWRREQLHKFIELANLLPATHPAGDLDELIGKGERGFQSSEYEFSSWLEQFKLLLVYLDRFPPHFREYVLEDSKGCLAKINMNDLNDEANITHFSKILGALNRYDEFRRVREKLRTLVRIAHTAWDERKRSLRFFHRVPVHASLSVEKDGTARVHLDSFAEAIDGVDATRIRECNDCQRIFWATRKDQSCCSKECANRYHVRRHREKYASDPVAYKLSRLDREEKRYTKKGK